MINLMHKHRSISIYKKKSVILVEVSICDFGEVNLCRPENICDEYINTPKSTDLLLHSLEIMSSVLAKAHIIIEAEQKLLT